MFIAALNICLWLYFRDILISQCAVFSVTFQFWSFKSFFYVDIIKINILKFVIFPEVCTFNKIVFQLCYQMYFFYHVVQMKEEPADYRVICFK